MTTPLDEYGISGDSNVDMTKVYNLIKSVEHTTDDVAKGTLGEVALLSSSLFLHYLTGGIDLLNLISFSIILGYRLGQRDETKIPDVFKELFNEDSD